jgi:hypothetical protein
MRTFKEVWRRRIRPLVLTAIRRHVTGGVPTPRRETTVSAAAALAAGGLPGGGEGLASTIPFTPASARLLPPRSVGGDMAAFAAVLDRIDDAAAREAHVRRLEGTVVERRSPRFAALLADGRVTHDSGIVFSAAGGLLTDVSGLGVASDLPTNPLRLSFLPRPRRLSLVVAVLSTGRSENYYHWMTEAVPRLELYERSGLAIDRYYAPTRRAFQRESLALLGIPPQRILPASCHAHVEAEGLLVAPLTDVLGREKIDYLAGRLATGATGDGGAGLRLYVGRGGRRSRAIVDEPAMVAALAPLGFVPCRLETMPLAAQVAAFRRAECVVAPHGAGLTNLAFCRPGTRVLEIGTPYRPWTCFWEIAHHRGLAYHLHLARPTNVRHFDPSTGIGDSDLEVDPAAVRADVERLLAGRAAPIRRAA